MTRIRPPLSAILFASIVASGGPALGQDVSPEALAECAGKTTPAEKLACYESLTEAAQQEKIAVPPPRVEEPVKDLPASEPSPAAPPADASTRPPVQRTDAAPEEEPEQFVTTVRQVTQSRSGRLYFHFSDGQVWRQNEPRRFRYPREGEFDVTVSRGMMGDYRLRIDENSPMTRIVRVE